MQRTRIGRATAIAMAIATLGVAAAAAPASAQTDVGPLSDTTGLTEFGNNYQFGVPQDPGFLAWNQAGANTVPRLTGTLFLNNSPGVRARLQLVHYLPNGTTVKQASPIELGTGALDIFPVDFGSTNSTSTHVHVKLRENRSGSWQTVDDVHCTPLLAACI
jgi:hypothetical protein